MKKTFTSLILMTIGTAALAEAPPAYLCSKAFEGPYFSANIGFGEGGSLKKFIDAPTGTVTHKNDLGFNGVDGGIGLGYMHRFGKVALGLAFDANWIDVSGSHKHIDGSETISPRLMNSLQLYGRAGYVVNERMLPFIGLGWDNSAWKLSGAHTSGLGVINRDKIRHRQNALLWKAGLDILVNPWIVVGFEYTGTIAERIRYFHKNGGFFNSWRHQYNKYALTLKYIPFAKPTMASACKFSPCRKAFQGIYLSGNIGYGSGVGKRQKFDQGRLTRVGFNHTNGVDGGLGTGYMHRFGKAAFGLAFDANWSSAFGRRKNLETGKSQAARLKNSLQLYARAGHVFDEFIMPFVGLGWDNSAWQQTLKDPQNKETGKKRINALLWKVGSDFLVCEWLALGFEYTGTMSQKKTYVYSPVFVDTDSDRPGRLSNTWRPQYNKFALTAKLIY